MLNRHGFVILCISEKTPPIMATGGVFIFIERSRKNRKPLSWSPDLYPRSFLHSFASSGTTLNRSSTIP